MFCLSFVNGLRLSPAGGSWWIDGSWILNIKRPWCYNVLCIYICKVYDVQFLHFVVIVVSQLVPGPPLHHWTKVTSQPNLQGWPCVAISSRSLRFCESCSQGERTIETMTKHDQTWRHEVDTKILEGDLHICIIVFMRTQAIGGSGAIEVQLWITSLYIDIHICDCEHSMRV